MTREKLVERLRKEYPVGTRLVLDSMDDPFAPVESGTHGTVRYVDDMGQIGMQMVR